MIDQSDATANGEPAAVQIRRGRGPGSAWAPVARGLHRTGEPGLVGDLRAWQAVTRPSAAFTHLTSAQVRGWWIPPLPAGLPVWITQTKLQNASTRNGLVVIRRRGTPASELIGGIRLATPAETLVTCARDLG